MSPWNVRWLMVLGWCVILSGAARLDAADDGEQARPIELVGIIKIGEGSASLRFRDPTSGAMSEWKKVGQTVFGRYAILAFDSVKTVATLEEAGERFQIRIIDSKVRDSGPVAAREIRGSISLARGATVLATIQSSLEIGKTSRFELGGGEALEISPAKMEDGNLAYAVAVERRNAKGEVVKRPGPRMIATPGQSFSLSVGDMQVQFQGVGN